MAPRDRFRKLIAAQKEAKPRLPLVHTTDGYTLINVLDDERLVPSVCDVFIGEPLLYFFYGRPSYRVNTEEAATSLDFYLPVCLIFNAASVTPIKRIFPFDSGGFGKKLYRDALHDKMKLDDFGLEPDPSTPGKVVSLFFGSSDSYLAAKANQAAQFDPGEPEAVAYQALISQRLGSNVDNRSAGIEIQYEGNIELGRNIEAIVLPSTLLDSDSIKNKLLALKITPLPYNQIDRQKPSEYVTKIFDLCFEYYKRKGLVK